MRLSKLFVPAVLAVLTVAVSAPAFAQSIILVVDTQQVWAETSLGQDVNRQLQELEVGLRTSIQSAGDELRGEIEDLQRQRTEFIITDEVFEQRYVELQQRDQALRARMERSGQAMQFAQGRANEAFFQAIVPELSALMEERNGTVLFERRQTVLTSEDADITAEVITRVDARITELEVQLLPPPPTAE